MNIPTANDNLSPEEIEKMRGNVTKLNAEAFNEKEFELLRIVQQLRTIDLQL